MEQNHLLQEKIFFTIEFYRGLLLDAVEAELGETSKWPRMRSRLLKILGDRGLEGKLKEIITDFSNSSQNEVKK